MLQFCGSMLGKREHKARYKPDHQSEYGPSHMRQPSISLVKHVHSPE